MNYNAIRIEDDALRRRTTALFGGYRNAVEAAGFMYDSVRIDTDMASYYGNVFENIIGEIFEKLGMSYEQYAHSKYNPDFVLDKGRWIDAKLSEWTIDNRNCDTIEKYLPHCKTLTIVYLRGRDSDRMYANKVRLIHVNKYVKQLPRRERGYFYAKINDITTKLNEIEKDAS